MPNIKSAKKRVLVTEKKSSQNKMIKSSIKTATKKFLNAVSAGNKEEATKLFAEVSGMLDSACSKNIIHKNNAANKKSGLAKKLDKMTVATPVVEAKEEVKVEAPVVEEKKTTVKKATTATAEDKPKTTRKTTAKKAEAKTDAE